MREETQRMKTAMNVIETTSPVPLRTNAHGVIRVGQTRVRLDTVVTAWRQGESPEQIVENFNVLDLADVYAVVSYYLHHRVEVDAYVEKNRQQGESLRAEHEPRSSPVGIRDRLLARRAAAQQAHRLG